MSVAGHQLAKQEHDYDDVDAPGFLLSMSMESVSTSKPRPVPQLRTAPLDVCNAPPDQSTSEQDKYRDPVGDAAGYIDAGCIREKERQTAAELRISLLLKRLKNMRMFRREKAEYVSIGSRNPAVHAVRRRALKNRRGAKINGRNFTAMSETE
jgi:hypothetical protein